MIALALLVAGASAGAPPTAEQVRFEACVKRAAVDPEAALREAGDWRLDGGHVLPRQCEGMTYAAEGKWLAAATAFENGAREAERGADPIAAVLWLQAGNAQLAARDPARAVADLDAALARGTLAGQNLGEAFLDRARAHAALGELKLARSDLDAALKLVPADPLGWLLSATLARKQGDMVRARADIEEAATRSPDDASVALEAGNIALMSGSEEAARTAWQAAVANAPGSPAGKSAADALARLGPAH